jgi:hypothetical protein
MREPDLSAFRILIDNCDAGCVNDGAGIQSYPSRFVSPTANEAVNNQNGVTGGGWTSY